MTSNLPTSSTETLCSSHPISQDFAQTYQHSKYQDETKQPSDRFTDSLSKYIVQSKKRIKAKNTPKTNFERV